MVKRVEGSANAFTIALSLHISGTNNVGELGIVNGMWLAIHVARSLLFTFQLLCTAICRSLENNVYRA